MGKRTLLSVTLLLTACAVAPSNPSESSNLSKKSLGRGVVHGGQQPIAGATIQLYAAGSTADRSAASPLLTQSVTTNTAGSFDITGLYTCPSDSAEVYLTASGGNPGYSAGTNNQASVLMLSLGPCSGLSALDFIVVNEVTTVASVFPVKQFMADAAMVGAVAANSALLADDFAQTDLLINPTTGLAPSSSTLILPSAALYALANSVAACVNSPGGIAGDGSPCGQLFADATPTGGTAPTDTVSALLNIAMNPTQDVGNIFSLASPTSPFQPALSTAPATWALKILQANPVSLPLRDSLIAEYLLTEGSGTLAHDTSGNSNTAKISGSTWESTQDLSLEDPDDAISLPTALNTAQAWQIAFYEEPYMPGYSTFGPAQPPEYGDPGARAQHPSLLCGTDRQHLCLLNTSSLDNRSLQRFYAISTDGTESAAYIPFGWHVFTLLCGAPGPVKTHYLYDGVEVSSYITQGDTSTCPVLSTAYGSGNYQIGGPGAYGDQEWFTGKIGAAWAWNKTLTVDQGSAAAKAALDYLHAKGVPTAYSNVELQSPQIVAGLDSRTYGQGLEFEHAWPFLMQLTDATYAPIDLGVTGAQAQEMCLQFDLVYGPYLASSQPSIVMIWGGVNDLQTTQTYQQVADSLNCMVVKAKATGARVILGTEISALSNTSSRGDNGKNGLNAILRTQAWGWGIDNLAELATQPILGADGASSNSAIFPDTLHPSTLGETYITAIMQNSVNELLGSTSSSRHTTDASTYTEQAGDRYLELTGTGQSVTLPSCIGYSLPRYVTNNGSGGATLSAASGEALSGDTNIASGATATLTSIPGSLAASGCTWTRTN